MIKLHGKKRFAIYLGLALVALSDGLIARASAQDIFADGADPFAAENLDATAGEEAATDDALGGDDPFASSDAAVGTSVGKRPDDTSDEADAIPPSSLGDSIAILNPQTNAELFRAVDQLVRAERPEVARGYLTKLIEATLNETDLAELHQRFGSAAMLRLTRSAELAPEGAEFARRVLQAASAIARDPARLRQWAEQLGNNDRRTQILAARNLLRARGSAVEPVVRVMAEAPGSRGAQVGAEVLRYLGEETIEPLLALQDSGDARLRSAAIIGLGQTQTARVGVYLVQPLLAPRDGAAEAKAASQAWSQVTHNAPLPSHDAAVGLLRDAAARAYAGTISGQTDENNQLTRWVWDTKSSHVVPVFMPVVDAAAQEAARLYEALVRLQPDDFTSRDYAVIARLQVAQVAAGLDSPLATEALVPFRQLDEVSLSMLLDKAMKDGYEPAAIALMQLIGNARSSALVFQRGLQSEVEQPAPLVRALTHPNRRLRFAAAAAIQQLDPPASFDGASRFAETLGYFSASTGQSQMLVAHPNGIYASQLAGHFSSHGYKTRAVDNERDLLEQTAASPDIEFVLISDAMNRWSVWSLIEMLRANPKTARLPVVVLGRRDRIAAVERLASEHARVMAWVENLREEDLSSLIPRIAQLSGRDAVNAERRLEQGQAALSWLNQRLATERTAGTPIIRQQDRLIAALNNAALAPDAMNALAEVGSAAAQVALLNAASENARPMAVRQAAAEAFQRSYHSFGKLLTRDQVVLQYERYNQSRYLDSSTQELLGSILDTLENPDPQDR